MMAPLAVPDVDNPEHRCLWCNKKMREHIAYPEAERPRFSSAVPADDYRREVRAWERRNGTRTGEYGYYHDNAFCSLRCASSFALAAALTGFRVTRAS